MAEENKYYWIKLRTDFFADNSPIDALMGMGDPNGAEYVCLYIKLCLMTANRGGRLCNEYGDEYLIPYSVDKIVRDAKYFSLDTVTIALELFKRLGLIYQEADGILTITGADRLVGCETLFAEKKRKYRGRLKDNEGYIVANDVGDNVSDNVSDNVEDNVREEIRDKRLDIRDKSKENKDKSKDKEKDKNKASATLVYYPEQPELNDLFTEYAKMRKTIKAPLTDAACKLEMKRLQELSEGDEEMAKKILEQAISKSWRGLYPIKTEKKEEQPKSILDKWRNA